MGSNGSLLWNRGIDCRPLNGVMYGFTPSILFSLWTSISPHWDNILQKFILDIEDNLLNQYFAYPKLFLRI